MRKLLLATAAAAGLALASAPPLSKTAEAACCVAYQPEHVARQASNIMSHFTSSINAMQAAISAMIIRSTGQMVNTMKEQVQGNAQIAQTTDERETMRQIEATRLKAVIDAQTGPMACNVITGVASNGSHKLTVAGMINNVAQESDEWDSGTGRYRTSSSVSGERAREIRLDMNAEFCNEDMERFGICEIGDLPIKMQGATLTPAKSLFGSNSFSRQELRASNTYMKNAINPEPQGSFQASLSDTNPVEARRLFATRQAHRARTAMAEFMLADIIAKRTPQETLIGDGADATTRRWWAEATARDVVGYSPRGDNFPNGVSWNDYMELRSRAWFSNPEFWRQVNDANTAHNMKTLLMINSFMVYQNWETYKLLQQIGAVGATQLAIMADEHR